MKAGLQIATLVCAAGVFAGCAGAPKMTDTLPTCSTNAACDAHDGKTIVVIGTYRLFPDQPNTDYTGVPRAVRLELDDGPGPFLEPYWHKEAVRPDAEIRQHIGKKVRVMGRYVRQQPQNPDDPPYASSVGGPCLHPVQKIESAP